jgi:RND family efflux transporter MFP subunit
MNMMDRYPPEAEHVSSPLSPLGWLRRIALFAAPLLVLGGGVVAYTAIVKTGPKPEESDERPGPTAVQFAVAESRATAIAVSVQGQVRPRTQATLAAQVSGRVEWTSPAFVAGGNFRRGDVLLRLDSRDAELAVVRARAQVAQSQEALAREEAEAELARQDWEELGRGEASPLVLREPQLAQARAQLAASQSQLQGAELELSRTRVTAPFDGRVMEKRANVGDFLAPGTPVAEIFATDVMEVRIPLTDSDLSALQLPIGFIARNAQSAPIAHVNGASGGQSARWEGRLVRVEANVEATTRLVYGIIEVRDPFSTTQAAPLAPGLFVNAELDSPNAEQLIALPRPALKRNGYVYVIGDNNLIQIREVTPVNTTNTDVFVRTGVQAGERVVISALPSPREGMEVTPMAAGAAAAPAATSE